MGYKTKEEVIAARRLEIIKEIREFSEHIQDLCDELEYRVDPEGYITRYIDADSIVGH